MAWDSGGFMGSAGESSQGMDADAVGSGLGADALGNIFGPNVHSMRALAMERARLGLPALSPATTFHDSDTMAYLNALQREISQINQNVQNNNTIDSIAAHNQNIIGQRMSNQGPRLGNRTTPLSGPWQSIYNPETANFLPTVMGGYPPPAGQSGPYPMGGMPMGSQSGGWPGPGVSGSYNPGINAGDSEGGGEPYIRPRRLAYRNAYDQWDEQGGFGGGM